MKDLSKYTLEYSTKNYPKDKVSDINKYKVPDDFKFGLAKHSSDMKRIMPAVIQTSKLLTNIGWTVGNQKKRLSHIKESKAVYA